LSDALCKTFLNVPGTDTADCAFIADQVAAAAPNCLWRKEMIAGVTLEHAHRVRSFQIVAACVFRWWVNAVAGELFADARAAGVDALSVCF
jgi:hypothetical protein